MFKELLRTNLNGILPAPEAFESVPYSERVCATASETSQKRCSRALDAEEHCFCENSEAVAHECLGRPKSLPRQRLSLAKKCVFSLIPLLVLLGGVEIMARCLGWGTSADQRFEQIEQIIVYLGNEPGQSIFEPDPECFWRLKPNVVLPLDRGPMWGGRMSNSHGLHSREVSIDDVRDRFRVLCFGDSSTFAFGVGMDDAWPNQLHEIMNQEKPSAVEVLNAGIPGQTTYQGRQRLNRELTKWKPQLTFITFGNNDGWRWDGQADKDHARPVRSGWNLLILNRSCAWRGLVAWREASVRMHSAHEQLRWAKDATRNYFDPNAAWTPRVSLEDFAENLRAMVEECRRHECEPVLVVWPDQRQFLGQPTWRPPYQAAMRRVASELKTRCLDLVPVFERSGDWAIERFLPNDVVHLDPVGNRFVSDAATAIVREITEGKRQSFER